MTETLTRKTTSGGEEVRELIDHHDSHSQEVRHRRFILEQQTSNTTTERGQGNSSHDEIDGPDDDDELPMATATMSIQQSSRSSATSTMSLPIHQTNVPRVCCAILASITTGGTTYAFGLYGNALKKSLHLTQSQLDTISAVFFSAGLLSFIPGGFADRYGTRLGISMGGVSGALSLLLFWFVSKGWIPFLSSDPTVVVMVLSTLSVGIFLSCALITGSVFKIISCQCGAGSKGSAVGVAKGFVGLGSGAYACIFDSIRQPNMSELDFLPMCAFFFVVAASIPSWWILPSKESETIVPDVLTPLHFQLLYASLMVLAVLIIGNALRALHEDKTNPSKDVADPNYFVATFIILAWWGPILVQPFLPRKNDTFNPEISTDRPMSQQQQVGDEDEQETFLHHDNSGSSNNNSNLSDLVRQSQSEENVINGIPVESLTNSLSRNESLPDDDLVDDEEGVEYDTRQQSHSSSSGSSDKNLMQMLSTPSAWMMLWSGTILVGGGTVVTNNLGQMVEALEFSKAVVPATLALFSVAQSGGRVITGAISEAALSYNTRWCCIDQGIPRPFFFIMASIAAVLSHTMLVTATEEVFFVFGVTLSGIAFGMVWPLLVLCVGEIYGTTHVGANYMFYDGVTSAAGTFLLSKIVAQHVYEEHVDPHSSEGNTTCIGQACFRQTNVMIVILSLTCIVTSAMLQYNTRDVYNKKSGSGR